MGKSARDDASWGKPPGWGEPPEGKATPELVSKNARWALITGSLAVIFGLSGVVFLLGMMLGISLGMVAMSLGMKARALAKQLGATSRSASIGVVAGAAAAVLSPLLALGSILVM